MTKNYTVKLSPFLRFLVYPAETIRILMQRPLLAPNNFILFHLPFKDLLSIFIKLLRYVRFSIF